MSEKDLVEAWARSGMRRREFLALLGAGAAGLLARDLFAAEAVRRRPNILVIVADDLGYADLGCQSGKDILTPHIDSLARNGVRFTSGYVSCPVCSPTRAGLMTGRYQERFGHEFNPGPLEPGTGVFGLPLSQITMADVLKAAGYHTGMVGKWHLGAEPVYHPMKRGFEEFFGFLGGAHSYLNARADARNPILRGTEPVDEKEYLTDAFTREAVAYIGRHANEPFFLYLTYNAVHQPPDATSKYLDRFKTIADERRRIYAAKLSAMDDGVGAVLAKLKEAGAYQDTLLFFLSDNGGPPVNGSSNGPLRGFKATVWEGGIRVPFLVQWPRRIKGGATYDQPVISLDIMPTAAAVAGGKLPTDRVLDGVNLIPRMTGRRKEPPHPMLFWRFGENRKAVRAGDWKLVQQGAPPQLFDLSKDTGEADDLSAREPGRAKQLGDALAAWESQLVPPLWGPAGQARAARAGRRQGRRRRALEMGA